MEGAPFFIPARLQTLAFRAHSPKVRFVRKQVDLRWGLQTHLDDLPGWADTHRLIIQTQWQEIASFDKSPPQYLSEKCTTYEMSETLCSSSEKLLEVPLISLKTFGEWSFAYSAPHIWNSLPTLLEKTTTQLQFHWRLFFLDKPFTWPLGRPSVCACECMVLQRPDIGTW